MMRHAETRKLGPAPTGRSGEFTSRGTSSDSSDRTVRLCNNKGAGKNIVLSNTGRVRIENGTC